MKNIFNDGILVDVNVSYWSGTKSLKPEDLGLNPQTVPDAYRLGRKFLIPAKTVREFRTLEGQARRVVTENSFKFPIGNANFVPLRKFSKVLVKLQELQAKYDALCDQLIANYDTIRQDMIPKYREAAEAAYMIQAPTGVQTFNIDDRESDKAAYIDSFLKRIEAFYPASSSLKERFSLSWDVFQIAAPKLKLGDADTIANTEEERQALEREYHERATKKIDSFVDDVVKTLRAETIEICSRISENIKNGKVVRANTLQSLRDYVDRFRELNFVGDGKIEEELNTLRKDFLDAHTYEEVSDQMDLQDELKRRLSTLVESAGDLTDISAVTGEYRRKVDWQSATEAV